jgi:nucleoside-triphosphatase
VIRTVAERVRGRRVGGFYTEEIRVRGQRQGFALVTFEGRRAVIARVGDGGNRDQPDRPRVGKYAVDVDVIDAMARSTIASEDAAELHLVDEIGKMECLSPEFVSAMRALLDKRVPVVATVGQRGGGFIEEVKRRRDVVLWDVTRANRDEVPARVLQWIEGRATNRGAASPVVRK